MVKAPAYTSSGAKAAQSVSLPDEVFGVEVNNHELLHQTVRASQAATRRTSTRVKTRAQVRGGGRKPWRQKGLGKARAGSIRSPIWKGGGVAFGPTGQENYQINLAKKAKRLAVRQALSLKAQAGAIMVADIPAKLTKTKDLADWLAKLKSPRRALLLLDKPNPELVRAAGNLTDLNIMAARFLSPYNILKAEVLIISRPALGDLSSWLATAPKPKQLAQPAGGRSG